MGVFVGQHLGVADYAHFMLFSTAGNIVGGSVFVALLKYGHVVRGGG
jgi:formate/nitrite transporter FocA (FNT family)